VTSRRVLVLGGGGREHAIAAAIARSPRCAALFVAPGNAGTPGERVAIDPCDTAAVVAACRRFDITLVVVGPEAPLAAGVADALGREGIDVFGPQQSLARLESSKAFTRELAASLGLPSPRSATFGKGDVESAVRWCTNVDHPVVVKCSGLAAGKGVVVPESLDEALAAVRRFIATDDVVIEERLFGAEVSLISMCDGMHSQPFPLVQDHKRRHEGDLGPNTGGMGAYGPIDAGVSAAELDATFVRPVVEYFARSGTPYVGAMFAGIILTPHGPRLLEFNCRFGDPETQVLLELLDDDLLDVVVACVTGRLDRPLGIASRHSLGVVVAAHGYPDDVRRGDLVAALPADGTNVTVFHAGTERVGGRLVTAGGRIVTVVGRGPTLHDARTAAYDAIAEVRIDGAVHRRDIGWRAKAASLHTYSQSGVSIDEGTEAVALMRRSVESTMTPAVLRGVGAFGGSIDVSHLKAFDAPVLVASTDGVGTKVELAARTRRLRGVGVDIVNHCVNDVLVQRAKPLFFLDYLASSKLSATDVAEVVSGMADACVAAGCVLIGGETAEMPGVYRDGAFDVAGTLVGVAERERLLPRTDIVPGDVLIGIASSGPHTNGYSYLRAALEWLPLDVVPAGWDRSLLDALLEPHRSYLPVLDDVLRGDDVKALVHVTGGGLPENLPRVLPAGLGVDVMRDSWPVPPLFRFVRDISAFDEVELYRTLNMGIGMVVVTGSDTTDAVRAAIPETVWEIGRIVDTHDTVKFV
jgi:phosphoribosylamine--glycine ligase/phosphoribosylaminoimidazole synthetase